MARKKKNDTSEIVNLHTKDSIDVKQLTRLSMRNYIASDCPDFNDEEKNDYMSWFYKKEAEASLTELRYAFVEKFPNVAKKVYTKSFELLRLIDCCTYSLNKKELDASKAKKVKAADQDNNQKTE